MWHLIIDLVKGHQLLGQLLTMALLCGRRVRKYSYTANTQVGCVCVCVVCVCVCVCVCCVCVCVCVCVCGVDRAYN